MLKKLYWAAALALTACGSPGGDPTDPNAALNDGNGDSGSPTVLSTQDKLQGSWHRVGQYCGTVYSTGLPVLHTTFTSTTMTVGMTFVCDNQIHIAQNYDARYDHDTVQVEMTSAASGSCPMTYASSGSPGWDTYTANILDDNGVYTLNLTVGTCGGGAAKIDVYAKD